MKDKACHDISLSELQVGAEVEGDERKSARAKAVIK